MQTEDRNMLTSALFALLTAKFEDAATVAVEGHRPTCPNVAELVAQLGLLTDQARQLTDAIAVVDDSRS